MYLPISLSIGRIFILFTVFMMATVSMATETAVQDSTQVADTISTPGATEDTDTGTSGLPGSAWGTMTHRTGSQSSASGDEEKKKRVPKKTPEKTPRETPEEIKDAPPEDDDEDCVGSCIGGFLGGMFVSSKVQESQHAQEYAPSEAFQEQGNAYYEEETDPEPERIVTPADFSLVLDLSWWKSGPSEVWDEYKDGGVRFAVNGYFIVGENFEIGIDAGYSHAKGYPLFDYESSTMLESPQESHLYIFDTGIRAGLIHSFSSHGPFLRWGLGPRLFWVKETADLFAYSLPDLDPLDNRTESLEEWRVGGDLVISMLWATKSSVLVGFSTRLFVIPWDSSYTKALTLDHIGKKNLVGFHIGLAVQFNGL
jgi:hypothetical protein